MKKNPCVYYLSAVVLLCLARVHANDDATGLPTGIRNTQDPKDEPMAPGESHARLRLPKGFRATLFAAEPHVAQPVDLNFDTRGRLWVAECYTYEKSSGPWKSPYHDRISIFEDREGNGEFDKRVVFTSGVKHLTSALPGMGGVWATTTPRLVFIPDRDRDDVPDGDPVVVLDGWNDGKIGHCVFNGLTWGPDGWLWGRQGIQGTSLVGKPGTPEKERRRFNGGIWRYHPQREVFEVVCEGTTNPWGLDFDSHGQAFFTNCVIGHLFHVIPGAHYERMYGRDFTENTYDLIDACSDHIHWGGGPWTGSRSGKEHDEAGGGHAHCGLMIYLGDNWPAKYRGALFMNNIHGRRVNQDRLERRGSGYVGRHAEDLFFSGDPWFRGISLKYGPDGGVYLSDWCDFGECHDNDGVHRTSGRIHKIVYGEPKPPALADVAGLDDEGLARLQLHENEWFARMARLVLQERASEGRDLAVAHAKLRELLDGDPDVTHKLRALWALWTSGGIGDDGLEKLLGHENEHVRSWAVRLLVDDRDPPPEAVTRFAAMASSERSALVRLFLASALQRLPLENRWAIVEGLVGHAEDAEDPNLPLMIWYGMEPLVAADPARAIRLVSGTKLPTVRRYIARRAASARKR